LIALLAILSLGFFLGMRHATDPDHVIAVSTIVSREGESRRAALVGAAWGLGHTLTILVVGSVIVIFRIVLPARIGLALELAVGLMLIVLGLRNLSAHLTWSVEHAAAPPVRMPESNPHYHAHGDYVHAHSHATHNSHPHDPQRTPVAAMDRTFQRSSLYRFARPLIVGVIHGLAGSAAIALLVLSTISSPGWAMGYLLIFGFGTILGMMLVTVALGSGFSFAQRRFALVGRHMALAAGVISIVFGLFIAYQTGFAGGLFTLHPHWIPR
jgi:high-affinity nickel-transport protein